MPTESGFKKCAKRLNGCSEEVRWEFLFDYYYAVSMPVVKELVDQIGGLTYTLDFNYSMAGRQYTAGEQFMDGQAVLDYLRVRRIYPRSI